MSVQDDHRAFHSVEEFRSRKTIIVGEVNTGKTVLLSEILRFFIEEGEKELSVIDMAPESTKGIGGKMSLEQFPSVRHYTTEIVAPRLTGKTTDEVRMLAELNAKRLEEIFSEYLKTPGRTLFINDVSIYLQAGSLKEFLAWLDSTPTVIMNGYYGSSLGGGKLGEQERGSMKTLQEHCDRVIEL